MRGRIKKLFPPFFRRLIRGIRNRFLDGYAVKSYSQDGEDLVIASFVEMRMGPGFYVDIGAHHPKRFSNTFHFYKLGWRGINVDATPGSMDLFKRWRPRDINLELAVSSKKQELKFHLFSEPALNGFDGPIIKQYVKNDKFKLIDAIKLKTISLKEIFEQHLPVGQEVDFLSVDVEGMDLNVLESNDWSLYRPHYIIVELLNEIGIVRDNDEVTNFLLGKGYAICAKSRLNGIFVDTLNFGKND